MSPGTNNQNLNRLLFQRRRDNHWYRNARKGISQTRLENVEEGFELFDDDGRLHIYDFLGWHGGQGFIFQISINYLISGTSKVSQKRFAVKKKLAETQGYVITIFSRFSNTAEFRYSVLQAVSVWKQMTNNNEPWLVLAQKEYNPTLIA